jgi:hypothetical protein
MTMAFADSASAEYEANTSDGSWMEIREPVENEGDTLLQLSCGPIGFVDVHLGGVFAIGKGEHEAVSATLSAGKLTAQVKGLSIETSDAEMTGGIELITALRSNDPLFAVLTSGQEISLQGSERPERFTLSADVTKALKTFLAACA